MAPNVYLVATRLNEYFSSRSKAYIISLAFSLLIVLGIIDHVIGPELSFSIFYIAPIGLATWYAGRDSGFLMSLVGALVWLTADVTSGHRYPHFFIPVWNSTVRLVFFLIVTTLSSAIKRKLENEANLADTDSLTGLANSRRLFEQLEAEVCRSKRYNHAFTIAYIDLDNFKSINDTQGHAVGDEVLRTLGHAMKSSIRTSDFAARIGGDEFVVLFPETGHDAAEPVIQRTGQNLDDAMRENGWRITFSVGAMTFENPLDSVSEMIKLADDLMYEVKRSGKNNVLHKIWNGKQLEVGDSG